MSRRFPLLVLAFTVAACSRPRAESVRPPVVPVAAASPSPSVEIRRRPAARQGSAVLLGELDRRLVAYVADEDESAIRVIDVEDERELSVLRPGGVPAELVMLPDGRLVASLRDTSELVVLRGGGSPKSKLAVETRIPMPLEPIGLALSPDDDTLVATSGWGHAVTVMDAHTFARRAEHQVGREPRSVVISSDGKRAFVSHAVDQWLDVVALDGNAPKSKRIPLRGTEEILERMSAVSTQERAACQGFALAKSEDGRVFAPHVLVFSGEAGVTSGYGGGMGREAEVFHVPVVEEDSGKPLEESKTLRVGLDTPAGTEHCALPRSAVVGKAGLYVTCLGENRVELFDADVANPHDVQLKTWAVPAGPTAIALDEDHDRAVVWSQFAHTLTKLAIGGPTRPVALSSLTIQRDKTDEKLERGRIMFHATTDTRISNDGRACASCHPEGRDDTLVWSSPKGPRQTPMLVGRLEGAAPYGWNGDASSVSLHLVQTVKRLGGSGLDGADREALIAYVTSMRSPPSAKSTPEKKDAALRGAEVFRSEKTGCADCHGATGDMPDGAKHDVKSRNAVDLATKFDTPSLRFIGGSAPYFHDGRYPDLKTLLVKSDGKMGHTKHLSPGELDDLVSYLETL
jgi:mono/diheme cytochrome c family protein